MYDIKRMIAIYKDKVANTLGDFHAPRGNNKLGGIPAFNLLPIVTCSGTACKTCGSNGCYAVKNCLCHGYNINKNNCFKAWAENTALAKNDLKGLERCLDKYFSKRRRKPLRFFRIHSSGDFFSVEYARMWYRIAERYPDIKFLAFTKQWDKVRKVPFYKLDNFSLVLSGWTGTTIPEDLRKHYKVAVCVEDEQRPPKGYLECPGSCENCSACWWLKDLKKNVFFHKH